jgi:hypothetical protein
MPRQTDLYLYANTSVAPPITFVLADGTGSKVAITASANDTDLYALNVTSTDTASNKMAIHLYNGTTNYLLGTVTIPALAGFDASSQAINLINQTNLPGLMLNSVGKPYMPLYSGSFIRTSLLSIPSNGKTYVVTAWAKDF